MITVTENAMEVINGHLAESDEPYLRISIQGGGCSGFNYVFDFADKIEEDDFQVGNVLVDSMSMQYLQGATVKYEESLMGSQFIVDNPQAQTTCGCGSSFSV